MKEPKLCSSWGKICIGPFLGTWKYGDGRTYLVLVRWPCLDTPSWKVSKLTSKKGNLPLPYIQEMIGCVGFSFDHIKGFIYNSKKAMYVRRLKMRVLFPTQRQIMKDSPLARVLWHERYHVNVLSWALDHFVLGPPTLSKVFGNT
jgi:hypothetical protein